MKQKSNINPRQELLSLMRGFFATPLIVAMANNGVIQKILKKKKVKLKDFNSISNKKFLYNVFIYFQTLGLLKKNKIYFSLTNLGNSIFKRIGSFYLLHSYRNFINNTDKILKDKSLKPSCDRKENVIGSGLTNGKKFFPVAIDEIKKKNYDLIVDIGCGNGEFLKKCSEINPHSKYIAVDLSNKALKEAKIKLKKNNSRLDVKYFKCNGSDVEKWSALLNKETQRIKNPKILITMWYLIHEISNNKIETVIKYLNDINRKIPNVEIIIGEILKIDPTKLFYGKNTSIMPEFLFFHQISGQGVLSKKDYEIIEKKINYRSGKKYYFDYVNYKKSKTPSAVVWYLKKK